MGLKRVEGAVRRGKPGVRWTLQKPRRNLRLRLDRNTREGERQHIGYSLFSRTFRHPLLLPSDTAVQCSAQYHTAQYHTTSYSRKVSSLAHKRFTALHHRLSLIHPESCIHTHTNPPPNSSSTIC
jgi:hypothetical protein